MIEDEYLPSAIIGQHEIHELAKCQGFWQEPVNLAEKIALIHSEASELLEVIRNPLEDCHDARAEELADIAIRVMDFAEYLRIDLGAAIYKKHRKNKARPFRHAKRF